MDLNPCVRSVNPIPCYRSSRLTRPAEAGLKDIQSTGVFQAWCEERDKKDSGVSTGKKGLRQAQKHKTGGSKSHGYATRTRGQGRGGGGGEEDRGWREEMGPGESWEYMSGRIRPVVRRMDLKSKGPRFYTLRSNRRWVTEKGSLHACFLSYLRQTLKSEVPWHSRLTTRLPEHFRSTLIPAQWVGPRPQWDGGDR